MLDTIKRNLAGRRGELLATAGLFTVLVLTGLLVFQDYGVGWDEENNSVYGSITLDHLLGRNQDAHYYQDPENFWHPVSGQFALTHGPAYEMLLMALERASGLSDTPAGIKFRHLCVFLTLVAGAFFFHLFCRRALGDWRLGLLGAFFFLLHPRIFSHGFHNSMDIGFLCAFTLCMYTLLRVLERPSFVNGCIHGAACAVLVDVRIAGMIVPGITVAFWGLEVLAAPARLRRLGQVGRSLSGAALLFFPLVVLLWPVLWADPVGNFLQSFAVSAKDPWAWWEVYLGYRVHATEVPWHFTPVWMLVTTPPLYTGLALLGLAGLLVSIRPSRRFYLARRGELVALACLALPLVAVAVLRSTLFNGWRHMYFVYPGFLVLAIGGVALAIRLGRALPGSVWVRRGAAALGVAALLVGVFPTVSFMIRSHPHQQIYFNALTGGVAGARGRFQTGYWGPEYREALEQLLALRKEHGCCVYIHQSTEPSALMPVRFNAAILDDPQGHWIKLTEDVNQAIYFVSNFCDHIPAWHGGRRFPLEEIWSREVDGIKVLAVYRIRRTGWSDSE